MPATGAPGCSGLLTHRPSRRALMNGNFRDTTVYVFHALFLFAKWGALLVNPELACMAQGQVSGCGQDRRRLTGLGRGLLSVPRSPLSGQHPRL